MNLTDEMTERSYTVLPAGIYDFTVADVKHTVSSKGSPMWTVRLDVDNPNGNNVTVFDHIVEKDTMGWKFAQFFKAFGLFHKGMSTDEMEKTVGEIGKVELKVDPASGIYEERNSVAKYIEKPTIRETMKELSKDELPF